MSSSRTVASDGSGREGWRWPAFSGCRCKLIMNPAGDCKRACVLAKWSGYLDAHRQSSWPFEEGHVYARHQKGGPYAIENAIPGMTQALRRFTYRAGRQQNIEARKNGRQFPTTGPSNFHCLVVVLDRTLLARLHQSRKI